MWQVANHSPFAAGGYFVRDRDGAEHWVVAVVALFHIRQDGLLSLAEQQASVLLAPSYCDAGSRELRLEADLAPFRPQPDIIVSGLACQPGMAAGRQFDSRITVGRLTKSARFFGERRLKTIRGKWTLDGPDDVVGVRLSWRNALGGPDLLDGEAPPCPHNPVGMGWTALWSKLPEGTTIDLPHIENPAQPIVPGRPLPPPHGFGAVQPAWQPRLAHAGTYDAAWDAERAPLPPSDFSEHFHQAAPPDQVYPASMDGGVPVQVVGFHADGPYGFTLPQIVLTSRTRIGADAVDSQFRLVSMALDATAKVVRLTWNTSVLVTGKDHLLTGSRVMLKQMAGVA